MKSNSPVVLNAEQQKVVEAREGVYIVIASAGTGKTETLIRRYISMLSSGVPPKDILNLTFTNAGVQEMIKRIGVLNGESVFRTFHSFALDLLKQERAHIPYTLSETIIPVEMENYKLLFDLVKIYPATNWRTLQEKIEGWKNSNVLPDQAIDEGQNRGVEYFYALAYRDYEVKCRAQGWLDFDSVIRETLNLLETNQEVRNRWKRKYISIDECQDTDENQAKILELLFDGNIMCIGDLNQGVYEWRSARPDSLTNFIKTLPNAQTLFLGQNYRSTKKLVNFFKEILPQDNGIASFMISENEEGEEPTFTEYIDAEEEADQILQSIQDPTNTAIIARTNRQLFTFQRLCLIQGIKYKILGKRDLFDQNEIKKILSLAKSSQDFRPAHVVLSDLIQRHNLFELYKHSGRPQESNPIENLQSIVKMSVGKGNIHQFLTYLRKLTHARKSSKGITLSTAHQAKGNEWSTVYVVGVKQGVMPHKDGEIGEERRIWYVSCTRAAKELHISFYDNPSEFLNNYRDKIVTFEGDRADAAPVCKY